MWLHHGPMHGGPFPGGGPFLAFMIARLVLFALFLLIPWIIGLTYVRADAKRRGQPGWLWALVAFPLGWIAILAYLIVRTFSPQASLARQDAPPLAPPQG